MQNPLKKALLREASAPYRSAGLFHYQWARGKLRGDPVFAFLLDQGLLLPAKRVLDLGCGRGLLAAWFLAAQSLAQREPETFNFIVPSGLQFRGIDCDATACAIGNQALRPRYGEQLLLDVQDIRAVKVCDCDTVVLLDVLHYIGLAEQDVLLDRICAGLPPGGRVIVRVGNACAGWRFRFSKGVDLLVAWAHGLRVRQLACRTVPDWISALRSRGLSVVTYPMSEGTLFANVLLIGTAITSDAVK